MKAKLRLLLLAPVVAGALTIVLAGTGVPAASACVPPNCPVIKAPIVSTSAATGVTSSTATLNGTVNPNGTTATCVFEYGPTAGYGYRTSNQTVAPSQTSKRSSPADKGRWRAVAAAAAAHANRHAAKSRTHARNAPP